MKINILGGGTSGWWTAGYLRKNHPELEITLIESKNIPTVGVGESTMPNVRSFIEEMGINEGDWLDTCNGVRKYGNFRMGWNNFKHNDPFIFTFYHTGFDEWLESYKSGNVNVKSLEQLYNPDDWASYAYNIDAAKAWQIVKEQTKGVRHIYADIVDEGDLPESDLNIDCSGLRRVLVKDKSIHTYDNLNNNMCIVRRIKRPLSNYTETIGMDNGWMFTVTLSDDRAGCGYVFNNLYITEEQAKKEYMEYNKDEEFLTDFLTLKWEPGRLKESWQGKTVAVGLSSGFIEPLEANGLSTLVSQIKTLSRVLYKENASKIYNRMSNKVMDEVADFLWFNYACNTRDDTQYWRDHRQPCKELLLDRINRKKNLKQNLYPGYVYAMLGVYHDML